MNDADNHDPVGLQSKEGSVGEPREPGTAQARSDVRKRFWPINNRLDRFIKVGDELIVQPARCRRYQRLASETSSMASVVKMTVRPAITCLPAEP